VLITHTADPIKLTNFSVVHESSTVMASALPNAKAPNGVEHDVTPRSMLMV
jgi:hypothetical protein